MGYTLPQISEILFKADRTMYKVGSIAYDDMFNQLDEALDYNRDIIYIYKKAVEYADDFYVGTEKLDTVVEKLGAKISIYDYGQLNPIYSDATIVNAVIPRGSVLNDLDDVTITNLQDNQILRYSASLGQWVNTGPNAAIRSTQAFTATLNQTVFVTTSPFTAPLLDVYLNGVRLNSSSYSTFGNYTITLYDGCLADDILDVTIYDPQTSILDMVGYMKKSVYDIDDDGIVDDAEKITVIARNSTGSTIHKGKIVYLQGSTGNRPNMILAQANSEATSSKTFGVVVEDIADNADGHVAAIGTLHDLDTRSNATNPFTTDTLLDGDLLWLSATNAGYVTKTVPVQPNHAVFIGVVARTTPSFGRIVYKIQNGYELQELHNVSISSPTNGQVLKYNSTTGLWYNGTDTSTNIYTDNGVLTSDRTVDGGGFSLTLNPNTNLAGNLFGNTSRTRNSFSGSYTQPATVFSNASETFDGLTSTGNTLYMGQSNIEVTGGSSSVQSQGIDIEQIIKLSGASSRIFANNYIIQYRGYSGDISTNANNFMAGLYIITGHSKYETTTNIVTGNAYGYRALVNNYGGSITNAYGYDVNLQATTFSGAKSSTISNYYAFRSVSRIGASSGPTATVTNHYGLFLDTPIVGATGTITNRWGVYAPDVAMRHYLNGNLLLGSTSDTGLYKLDVTGAANFSTDIKVNGLTVGKGASNLYANTALGENALRSITSGNFNTAVGRSNSYNITIGQYNTSFGNSTLFANISSDGNTAIGMQALKSTTGQYNTALGMTAGANITSGQYNTIVGAYGFAAGGITTGSYNTVIGSQVSGLLSSLSNNIILADGQGNMRLIIENNGTAYFGASTTYPTINSSAQVQIDSTVKGFLPPRMTEAQKNAISSPASGLIIYQTDGVEGLYVRTSTTWRTLIMS